MNFEGLNQIAVLALATSAISVTTSKARVFTSVRSWIASHNKWLGDLVSCTYCTSHWIAIAFVAIYRPVVIKQWIVVDLVVSMFVTVAISAVMSGLITKLNPFHGDVADHEVAKNFERGNVGNAGNARNAASRRY